MRTSFVRVFKSLGNEVRADDLRPGRNPQDVRAAVGDGLVHNVPNLDLALVTANHSGNVVVHPLKQFFARGVRTVQVKTAKASAAETPASAAPAAPAAGDTI